MKQFETFKEYVAWWWKFISENQSKRCGLPVNPIYKSLRRNEFFRKEWKLNYRLSKKDWMIKHHWGYTLYSLFSTFEYKMKDCARYFLSKATKNYE